MRRILLTGCSGFVARHYLDYIRNEYEKIDIKVLGVDIKPPAFKYEEYPFFSFEEKNLMDEKEVYLLIKKFIPTEILHLAAFSSVTYSWEHPAECFNNNTRVFLSVLEAVRKVNKEEGVNIKILSVGSSEIYGNVTEENLPLREEREVHPINPYAVARQSQEALSRIYEKNFNTEIILTRSFNHIGPGQDMRFVVPSFIKRIKELKGNGLKEGVIETGDTSLVRDFLDVRDVVIAYDTLLLKGKPGEVYNICKGEGVSLLDVINVIGRLLDIKVTPKAVPSLIRPDDNKLIIGSPEKIKRDTLWEAKIPLEKTIKDMIEDMI